MDIGAVLTGDKDLEMKQHGIHSPLKIIFYFSTVIHIQIFYCKRFILQMSFQNFGKYQK
jgi:hypothetical protein